MKPSSSHFKFTSLGALSVLIFGAIFGAIFSYLSRYLTTLQSSRESKTLVPGRDKNRTTKTELSSPNLINKENSFSLQSNVKCFEIAASETVNILGSNISAAHYCVIDNICIDNDGTFVLFDDSRKNERYEFPLRTFDHVNLTRFEEKSAPSFYNNDMETPMETGITLLLRHTICCTHIRHFAEPLPALLSAFKDIRQNTTRQQLLKITSSPSIARIVMFRRIEKGMSSYTKFLLESVMRYSTNLTDPLSANIFKGTKRCFEKALVPSSEYSLFHDKSMGYDFRDALYSEILRNNKFLPSSKRLNQGVKTGPDGRLKFIRKERVLIFAVRHKKRKIVDKIELYRFLENLAKIYGAVSKTVEFGKLSPFEQAKYAIEADMLWSIHGNDFSNMMMMRSGSAIIELNPIFFFEKGYYEMSPNLGINHFAWTCTTPLCAFGGNKTIWNSVIGNRENFSYNLTSRMIHMRNEFTGEWFDPFLYPPFGYAGEICHQCDRMSTASPLASVYYTLLRDSDLMVMPHKKEIEKLFHTVAKRLGWSKVQ